MTVANSTITIVLESNFVVDEEQATEASSEIAQDLLKPIWQVAKEHNLDMKYNIKIEDKDICRMI